MVFFESLALLGGLKDVFLYNRDLYMFNREINQERIYHTEKMRIDQILLYREDLRTLFELTVGKMENYLVVNTLTLAFTLALFYAGKMPMDTPTWLMWFWGASLGTAVLFLIMSIWFAIYATITAQTLAVRLSTQWIRLPVPSQNDIAKASATAEEFEKQPRDALLRVPLVSKDTQSTAAARSFRRHSDPSVRPTAALPPENGDRGFEESESYPAMVNPVLEDMFSKRYTTFVEHFHLFRYLQENWAGYDAYARICVVIGTTQLLNAISYFGMAWFISHNSRWGGSVFTVLVIVFSTLHARMNILLSKKEFIALSCLLVVGPFLTLTSVILHYINSSNVYSEIISILTPISFAAQIATMAFYLGAASEENGALPTKYTTVVSIDVLGLWEGARTLGADDENDDDSLRWDERAIGVLTGWQARWLRDTQREAPVAALIPTSVDITAAERERYLTINREVIGGKHHYVPEGGDPSTSSDVQGGGGSSEWTSRRKRNTITRPQKIKNFPESVHMKTLPWVSFRQVSAVVILVWIAGLAISIAVAVRGDIPGWSSNPGSTPATVSGVALWAPSPHQALAPHNSVNTMIGRHYYPSTTTNNPVSIIPLLVGAKFFPDTDRRSPAANVRSIRAVTAEGLHVVVTGNKRYILTSENNLHAYSEYEPMSNFFDPSNTSSIVESRVPWCLWSDHVTMTTMGELRDCNDYSKVWTEYGSRTIATHYRAISGKYALHVTDRHVYKLAFYKDTRTVRVDTRITVPHVLDTIVDIARNEELVAILSSNGLIGLWSHHHNAEFPTKGVRAMPRRENYIWKNIVGAGGKTFVVFGEDKNTAANEAWYVSDILALDRLEVVNHSN